MKKKSQLSKKWKQVKGGVFKKEQTTRGFAILAAMALMVQTMFPSAAIAANELGSYTEFQLTTATPVVTYNSGDGTFNVALTGTGEASAFTWPSLAYYVRINWADGNTALSDTPSSGVTDTFANPNFGQTMTGAWSGEHTFAAAGTYNVVVEWIYNPNQPFTKPVKVPANSNLSNDGVRARITVPVTLAVPQQEETEEELPGTVTSLGATVCSDESGYRVSLNGEGSLSPYTWSSLGYYVRLNWDDSQTTYSDTPGSYATDTFRTLDNGASLTGTWEAMHTYASSGVYDVMVDLFANPSQPMTKPVKVPADSNLSNDVLNGSLTVQVDTSTASPCNQPEEEPEPELPLDIDGDAPVICQEQNGNYNVELNGTGGGSPYVWSSLGYYVKVSWDDAATDYSDTAGSNAVDTFYTPDNGTSLAGTWNADHIYTTAGTYNVNVEMFYNPSQPLTGPVKVPAASNLSNDVLNAATTIQVNLNDDVPDCITENQGSATLTITKLWEGVGPTPSEVTASLGGGALTLNASSSWSQVFNLTPGSYALSETPVSGYTSAIQCSEPYESGAVYLEAGDNATCTITNTDIVNQGTITIEKEWDFLNEEVTSTYPEFTVSLDGNAITLNEENNFISSATTVNEGTHTITEAVEGFDVAISCSAIVGEGSIEIPVTNGSFVLDETQNIYCTVTNTEVEEGGNGGNGGDGGSDNDIPGGRVAPSGFSGDSGAGNLTGNNAVGGGDSLGDVLGIQDTDEALLTCAEQYPDAALITGELDTLLAAFGFTRNTGLETKYASTLVPKLLVPGVPMTNEIILKNFIVYGIQSLLELGAGERAGIVASFVNLYGHLPENECDWQNVIRIGQGVVPVVKSSERELAMEKMFEEIYDRAADRTVAQDNFTVLVMTYGLRPDVRSIKAETQASIIFKGLFGQFPSNTSEWDIMRGIAYGGITVPGYNAIVR